MGDFLTMGRATSEECKRNLELIEKICEFLGVPLKLEKIEGPAAALIFLGIVLDSSK